MRRDQLVLGPLGRVNTAPDPDQRQRPQDGLILKKIGIIQIASAMERRLGYRRYKDRQMINLVVNGQQQAFDGDPSLSLILYLRDVLNLKSIRLGCLMASCKTCIVYVDQVRCLACSVTLSQLNNKSVVTASDW
jgi:2Fe-2S iron-sulfur cluster binding domain